MTTISLYDIQFDGIVGYKRGERIYEKLKPFSKEFSFGKSFLLDGNLGTGTWALSWIIGTLLKQHDGIIEIDGKPYNVKDRKKDAWCVRDTEIKNHIWGNQTVKWQIRHGLRTFHTQHIGFEQRIIEQFGLTQERYERPLSMLSHEAWRASCAIGLANGRKIFCFPYLQSRFVEENYHLWLGQTINVLKENNCLIVIPTKSSKAIETVCDETVSIFE